MARLHTFPLTLGGMPCHHRSLTRRDVHLWGQSEEGQGHPGGQLQYSLLLTSCSNWARCPDSRSGRRCRCSLRAYSDPRAASSSSEPPSTLQSSVQTCETGRTDGRTDGQLPTKVRSLPLFLACATISSYCCLCFCASSAGFAGRLLQQRIKTTAYFDFLLHGDGPMGSGQ